MKRIVSVFLLATILLQSCAVYQKRSVSIDKAYNKGKVKLITTTGNKILIENIEKTDTTYYGDLGSYKIRLTPSEVEGIYMYNNKKSGILVAIGIGAIIILIVVGIIIGLQNIDITL